MNPIGCRILPAQNTFSSELLSAYKKVGVAQIGDCMARLYGMVGLMPMHQPGMNMVGRAVTVKTRPGDNLFIHKALLESVPGDVLVVDAGGDVTNALFGELMMLDAKARGLAGVVLDGAVRDSDALRVSEFPVFARGISFRGPYKDGPGELNVPVSVGNQVVNAGDLIIGDADGVLAIPAEHVDKILLDAQAKENAELEILRKIETGTNNKPWVNVAIDKLRTDL